MSRSEKQILTDRERADMVDATKERLGVDSIPLWQRLAILGYRRQGGRIHSRTAREVVRRGYPKNV